MAVIDPARGPHGTLYIVVMSKNTNHYYQHLHALDATTEAKQFGAPVTIQS